MRIISGSAKGKSLTSPPMTTRPTSDRAREGFFSAIESAFNLIDGWHVDSISFLDLFAGSGAMGVEALSRGASEVVCVESNEKAIESIRANAQLVDVRFGSFQLHPTEVEKYLMQPRVIDDGFDIIFIDPPYEYSNESITNILQLIVKNNLLSKRGMVAIERKSKAQPFQWPTGLVLEKLRSYGEGSIYYGGFTQE
jgi:16S rRNA (guanine966-N2)-methyltransferase